MADVPSNLTTVDLQPSTFNPWPSGSPNIFQRIFDTGLGLWCYYTKTFLDPNPAITDTTPNNTGAFLAGSHTVETPEQDVP